MIIDHKGDPKCPRSLLFAVVYDNSSRVHWTSFLTVRYSSYLPRYLRSIKELHPLLSLCYNSDINSIQTSQDADIAQQIPALNDPTTTSNPSNVNSTIDITPVRPAAIPSLTIKKKIVTKKR